MTADNNNMIGTYQHNIDAKGRVIIPAKFREKLGDVFYATKGTAGNIVILSKLSFEELCGKIESLPSVETEVIRRYLFANAAELIPDRQGRVLLTSDLRRHASLEKDIVIVGVGSKIEIWDLALWNEYNQKIQSQDIISIMKELGL